MFSTQTKAGCKACTGASGVCGKKADKSELQDKLTGALTSLARKNSRHYSLVTEATDRQAIRN